MEREMGRWLLLVLVVGIGAVGCEGGKGVESGGDNGQMTYGAAFKVIEELMTALDYQNHGISASSAIDRYMNCLIPQDTARLFEYRFIDPLNGSVVYSNYYDEEYDFISSLLTSVDSLGRYLDASYRLSDSTDLDTNANTETYAVTYRVELENPGSFPFLATGEWMLVFVLTESGQYQIAEWIDFDYASSKKPIAQIDAAGMTAMSYWYNLKSMFSVAALPKCNKLNDVIF